MRELRGACGGGCYQCGDGRDRQDECYHDGESDPCQSSKCLANYLFEQTCVPSATQDCSGVVQIWTVSAAQYERDDTNCTHTGSQKSLWTTHYWGQTSPCSSTPFYVRCKKPTNSCSGTLRDYAIYYNGIWCTGP